MADDSMALLEMLRKTCAGGDVDILREGVRIFAQAIMEAEVSELTGLPKVASRICWKSADGAGSPARIGHAIRSSDLGTARAATRMAIA